jgi:hypothetical protein
LRVPEGALQGQLASARS